MFAIPGNITLLVLTEKGKDKDGITVEHENMADKCFGQETDLTVVLSAWYSAGFHTGRQVFDLHVILLLVICLLFPLVYTIHVLSSNL